MHWTGGRAKTALNASVLLQSENNQRAIRAFKLESYSRSLK